MTETKKKALQELLESDLAVPRELLGMQTQLIPFPQHCSCQRLMMYSSHSAQFMVLDQSEPPRIFTGMENVIGKFMFTKTRRDQDAHVIDIISKFNPSTWCSNDGHRDAADMPSRTVVYVGLDDHKVHYFDLDNYTYLHDGFGYMNSHPDIDQVAVEEFLPKDACLTLSPAWKDGDYCMGLNANVIYLSDWAVTEDACVISESFAKKCANLEIKQIRLDLKPDDVMLNLYGDNAADEYKVIPDIGEVVRHDGVLAAIRPKNAASYVSDMQLESLQRIEWEHDELHKAHPGDKILDIDVYINFDQLKKLKSDDTVYDQLLKIYNSHLYYYNEIIRVYESCKEQGLPISDEFNTLVMRCMELSNNKRYVKKRIKLCDPREPIEFITVVITYAHKREISLGSKLTGREGGKGVVSEIRPDDCMPTDEHGVRADIIMTPPSIINRMNPSQLYEQFWNRCADQVCENIQSMGWREAYNYIIGFCSDFRKVWAQALDQYLLDTDEKKKAWVEEIKRTKIIRLLAAWGKGHDYGYLDKIAKKYGVEKSLIVEKVWDEDTNAYRTVHIKEPALIGSKYLIYLGKIPDDNLASVEVGHVNQFETPIKTKSKRAREQSLVGLTPQKFGEDEVCMLNMSLGTDVIARIMCIHSAAPSVSKELFRRLLTDQMPTQLTALDMTTQDIINRNKNVLIFADMMGAIGYDVRTPTERSDK